MSETNITISAADETTLGLLELAGKSEGESPFSSFAVVHDKTFTFTADQLDALLRGVYNDAYDYGHNGWGGSLDTGQILRNVHAISMSDSVL